MRNINPYLCKKGYYVTEMYMGMIPGDGYKLISTSDMRGPFKTLERAREIFKRVITNDKNLNDWDFAIRGPEHKVEDVSGTHNYETIWYPFKERE